MTLGVIISTYNQPEWLGKCLLGFHHQTIAPDEIIIADDGSGDETRRVIAEMQGTIKGLKHVWHEDHGFRKTEILNKALIESTSDYLVFTDGDCIPRADFLSVHLANAREGRMLSGGYVKLSLKASEAIEREGIISQRCFDTGFLRQHMNLPARKAWKLTTSSPLSAFLDFTTTSRSSWNGHNSSVHRRALIAANGFDNRMKYGGEDRELGERLINAGMSARTIRHRAVCIHLDHDRGYITQDHLDVNNAIRRETHKSKRTRAVSGIDEL